MSFISLFEIIKVVVPDPNSFLCIPASAADAGTVNPKGIKTLLANGLNPFFVNGNPVLVIYLKFLQIELFYKFELYKVLNQLTYCY